MAGSTVSTASGKGAPPKGKKTAEEMRNQGKRLQAALKASRKAGTLKKRISATKKASLQFPVDRIKRRLKKGNYAKATKNGAPIYLAFTEVLKMAGNATRDNRNTSIIPRYLQLAIRNDKELGKLLQKKSNMGKTSGK
jgi:histone H2A